MQRPALFLAALAPLALAACKGDVVVTAQLDVVNPETGDTVVRPISDLVVRLLPYDRDIVFDSLTQAAPSPEPQIPDSLLQLQHRVAEAQEVWRSAESAWNAIRDRMKSITDQMQGLNRAEARYRALFREFQDLEGRLGAVERRMNAAFREFDSLQKSFIAQAEQLRLIREQWADEAFATVNEVIARRLKELGRQEYSDTTSADGAATFRVPTGQWWVYARSELPFNELYWNVPIDVSRGDPTTVTLSREAALMRPKL